MHGAASFLMQRYWRVRRGLTMGAQGIVIDSADRVLLIRHSYRPGWHFPGGGVEKHETVSAALGRELKEEAGIELDERPHLLGLYANFRAFPADHIALFLICRWRQPRVPPPNREVLEQGFFGWRTLPEGVIAPVRRRLAEVFGGAAVAEIW